MGEFERALPIIRRSECHQTCVRGDHAACFINLPNDPGGPTCCGIIQTTYDGYRKIKELPPQPVQQHSWAEHADIYRARFWDRAGCGEFRWPLSLFHFDAAVNHGTEPKSAAGVPKVNAGRLLQLAARVASPDGIVGPHTLFVVKAAPVAELCYRYLLERFFRYDDLADKNPRLVQFQTGGWEERLKALYREVS